MRCFPGRLGTNRLRRWSGWRPFAGCRILGTCSLEGWTEAPPVRPLSRHTQSSPAPDLLRLPRRLPDLYTIVGRDERSQLPTHRG
jgi:hypothetical protein